MIYEREVIIRNKLGIHARPAQMIVELAKKFKSDIYIEKDGMRANARSLLGILMLVAPKGTKLKLIAEGEDAKEAVEALAKLIEEDKFGED